MKYAIPHMYAEYGRYIDAFRAIPYYLDCLKPVERRLLFVLNTVAKNKNVKSARIIGDTIGKYHPHGDMSTYGALIGLVRRGFAIGQGNWGCSGFEDTEAAAYRYSEVKSNEMLNSLAFEFIKYVPWADPEGMQYEQPEFLPSPIPIGLIGSGLITGISFHTTKIPRYDIKDLVRRLIYLFRKEIDPNTPNEIIIPKFENCNVYEHQLGEFERILTTGEGSIIVVPEMRALSDGVHIYGKPPEGFTTLKNNTDVVNKQDQRKFDINDLTEKGILDVVCIPYNDYIDQEFIDLIFKLVTDKLNILCNVIMKDNIVKLQSIDNLLKYSYDFWVNTYKSKLSSDILSFKDKLFELEIIKVIQLIIEANKIRSKKDLIAIYTTGYKHLYPNISETDIEHVCAKHKIDSLLNHAVDTQSTLTKLNQTTLMVDDMINTGFKKLMELIPV